jgi:hypothetical protein
LAKAVFSTRFILKAPEANGGGTARATSHTNQSFFCFFFVHKKEVLPSFDLPMKISTGIDFATLIASKER